MVCNHIETARLTEAKQARCVCRSAAWRGQTGDPIAPLRKFSNGKRSSVVYECATPARTIASNAAAMNSYNGRAMRAGTSRARTD